MRKNFLFFALILAFAASFQFASAEEVVQESSATKKLSLVKTINGSISPKSVLASKVSGLLEFFALKMSWSLIIV